MLNVDGKFIICPVDGKILLYTDCFGCDKLIQVLELRNSVRVECEHDYISKFMYGLQAREVEVQVL